MEPVELAELVELVELVELAELVELVELAELAELVVLVELVELVKGIPRCMCVCALLVGRCRMDWRFARCLGTTVMCMCISKG